MKKLCKTIKEKQNLLLGKRVAISGSTGGIGRELCFYLAGMGASLVLLDRSKARSTALAEELRACYPDTEIKHIYADLENIDEVKAAADGTVTAVAEDAENGKMVTISHEADWLTTYGQLEDAVTVKKGDKVKKGQVIGSVDAPTKYGVALGEHLEFAMKQGGEPKDPTRHLEQK